LDTKIEEGVISIFPPAGGGWSGQVFKTYFII
jgi:hypothetical protein